jgi:hypothetical protein
VVNRTSYEHMSIGLFGIMAMINVYTCLVS